MILHTGDIHCGVSEGFGVVGLAQIRETLEKNGVTTLLVDTGDAVQGDVLGTLTNGSAIITLMNDLHYDAAIPGNHEFDYGMDTLMDLTKKAEFPYLSCNFNRKGELPFEPYLIKEAAGKKIALIGATTPKTLTSTDPTSFEDENGEVVYNFMQGDDGDELFAAIQKNVDEVREKGADYVVLLMHMGNRESDAPYNFQTIIERTSGIDVIFDGHSHDSDQVTMNDKDGHPVMRSAGGTKLSGISYMRISGEDGTVTCGIYNWPNKEPADQLFGIENEMSEPLRKVEEDLEKITQTVIAQTDVELVVEDTVNGGYLTRKQETNLGDLAADAFRAKTGAEIAFVNGGGLRKTIPAGKITYGDVSKTMPFANELCISELTGQQILDGLEWSSRTSPAAFGGFLTPSGLSYEIHTEIPSSCVSDTIGMFGGVTGEYRVKNVMVNGEPLDLKRKYRVAGAEYILEHNGDGYSMFSPENVVAEEVADSLQALIDYIEQDLGGTVGEQYANPDGEGRIKIIRPNE